MRKILGILNIVAGTSILLLVVQLFANAVFSVELEDPKSIIYLVLIFLVAGSSVTVGILTLTILKGKWWILAVINLILSGYVSIVLVLLLILNLG